MEQIFLDFTKEDGDNEEARDAEPLCDTPTSLNRLVVPHISGLGGGIKAGWWCLLSPSSTQPRVPHKGTSGSTATRTTGSRSSRASCGRPFRANVRDTRPQLATQATDRTRSLCCCCCTLHTCAVIACPVLSRPSWARSISAADKRACRVEGSSSSGGRRLSAASLSSATPGVSTMLFRDKNTHRIGKSQSSA